jgi:hypothetical protein
MGSEIESDNKVMKPIYIKEFSFRDHKEEEEVLFSPFSNFKIVSQPRKETFKLEKSEEF